MTIIQKHLEGYGNIVKKYQLYIRMVILLILMVPVLLIYLILNQVNNNGRLDYGL